MPQVNVNLSYSVDGKSYSQTGSVTGEGLNQRVKENFSPALVATLSTRTGDDVGVLTFLTDPGISVGARLDIYWSGGARRGMKASSIAGAGPWTVTVGTAAGDKGVGDVLPAQDTALTVGKVQSWEFNVTGNNILALVAAAAAKATIVLASAGDVEEWAAVFEAGAGMRGWFNGNGESNPIAGDTITKVFMSHGDATSTREVKVAALIQ
jgi:hypothetical protein